jgi:ornithine carbamoyltransferase
MRRDAAEPVHLVSLADWPAERLERVLRSAAELKRKPSDFADALRNRILLLLFQKPSLRTRVSFEAAMLRLGGHAIAMDLSTSPWGAGKETPADTARTVSRYVDGVMARLFRPEDMAELAGASAVPVINGLTDLEHPCQAIGDLFTLRERKGELRRLRLAWLGDGRDNVLHSLLDGAGLTGLSVTAACPPGAAYEPEPAVLERARRLARASGAELRVVRDPREAVAGADAVATDTWMSYHVPESEREARERALRPYRVTAELLRAAKPDAVFMHCLPARRGAEQTAEVLDGPQSIVFDQAENRLHTEEAVLLELLARA